MITQHIALYNYITLPHLLHQVLLLEQQEPMAKTFCAQQQAVHYVGVIDVVGLARMEDVMHVGAVFLGKDVVFID